MVLSQHADGILADLRGRSSLHVKTAEWLFRSVGERDPQGRVARRPQRIKDLIAVAGGDTHGFRVVIDAFRAPGCNFITTTPPGPLSDDTEVDLSHEALMRRWQQLCDPTRDAITNEPLGWLWREFEDSHRWRAFAVQARVFQLDISQTATLSPATTEAYQSWWPQHTPAWAARYAREKGTAEEEHREVEKVWEASKKALEVERARLSRETKPANEQVAILRQGARAWNEWRSSKSDSHFGLEGADFSGAEVNLDRVNRKGARLARANFAWASFREANFVEANLQEADLTQSSLVEADLSCANLDGASLRKADLSRANLSIASLVRADLTQANLSFAQLTSADLREANLTLANLARANLRQTNLRGAKLDFSTLVQADLSDADLTGCHVFGVSAWGLHLSGTRQQNLIITDVGEPEITVDNIEVAQLVYLMLFNEKVRDVIGTISTKVVLILGRFGIQRKAVLDALREELRQRDYLPILFDFDKPASMTTTEVDLAARSHGAVHRCRYL